MTIQIIIKSDGMIAIERGVGKGTLKHLQTIVGGLIQEVPHTRGTYFKLADHYGLGDQPLKIKEMWCNEEGFIYNLPFNVKATLLWLSVLGEGPFAYEPRLFGDVVVYV